MELSNATRQKVIVKSFSVDLYLLEINVDYKVKIQAENFVFEFGSENEKEIKKLRGMRKIDKINNYIIGLDKYNLLKRFCPSRAVVELWICYTVTVPQFKIESNA